jgi:hypothetical protein
MKYGFDWSSIIIAVLGLIVGYFLSYRMNIKMNIRENRRNAYLDFMEAFQDLVNVSNKYLDQQKTAIEKALKAKNKVILYGSDKTTKFIEEYFRELIKSNVENKPLPAEIHEYFQAEIVKSMRNDINLKTYKNQRFIFIKAN